MNLYSCPYCKRPHATEGSAKDCLASCLEYSQDFQTTVLCPFCYSEHDSLEDAVKCAVDCYLKQGKNSLESARLSATCATCSCCTDSGRRVFPCPHRQDVNPPDACAAYEPDVRECGTAIATEYNHMLLTHSPEDVALWMRRRLAEGGEEHTVCQPTGGILQ